MNDISAASSLVPDLAPGRFAVGQPVSRKEDPILLRGEGRYSDDLNLPGQLHGVVVRSRIAHGILKSVDIEAARTMPGVKAVLLAADFQKLGFKPMPTNVTGQNFDSRPIPKPVQWPLATGKVRYVGEPIAFVVAETRQQAKDAAEAIFADIDPLPAVTEAAARPSAPRPCYDEAPDNVVLDWKFGNEAAVDAAFAARRAHHHVAHPQQPHRRLRHGAALGHRARWRATASILRLGCQGVFGLRDLLRGVLDCPARQDPRAHRQCRRLLRHEGERLPGIYLRHLHAARITRQARQVDGRPQRQLPLGQPRPRPRPYGASSRSTRTGISSPCACAARAMSAPALSNSTTLPPTMNIVKNIIGVYRTPLIDAAVEMRLHQHHAGRRLSRRRPARGQLLHGAPGRHRRPRNGHRPGGTAPAQPHPRRT